MWPFGPPVSWVVYAFLAAAPRLLGRASVPRLSQWSSGAGVELELSVKDPASLVTDSCLEAFKMVLSSPPELSDRISLTLDCLSTILVQLVPQQYLVKTMQDKLVPVLSKLKEGERDYNINVKFKASKLSRQIMKALA